MRTIKYPWVGKFKNRTIRLRFFLKLASIWYILIGTGIYLTSNTNASFNDVEVINNHLHTQWEASDGQWDKSSLKFNNYSGFNCSTGLYQEITNGGQGMQGPSTFIIYYKEPGEGAPTPNSPGKEVFRGEIPALGKGQSTILVYFSTETIEQGTYKFMAYQRPEHPGTGVLWGEEIPVSDTTISKCSD